MKNLSIKIISVIVAVVCLVTLLSTSVFAGCPMEVLRGTNYVWAVTKTFEVGQPFDGIGELIEHTYNGPITHYKNREWWANGQQIKQGDIFTTPGQYSMIMRCDGFVATYELQVIPKLIGGWQGLKEITVTSSLANDTYRQGIDGFDPSNLVVLCTYRNDSTQELRYQDLEFYAGERGIQNYKYGAMIQPGTRFWVPGEKDLIIRVGNKETRIPFTVTEFVQKAELLKTPTNIEAPTFRTSEYSIIATYNDGTEEEINGNFLNITANGNRIFNNADYDKGNAIHNIKINAGQFSMDHQITASAKDVVTLTNGWYNLRAMNNYLNIDGSGSAELRKLTSNEAFYVENKENGRITLRMANGTYLGISDSIKDGTRVKTVNGPYLWNVYSENNNDIFSLRTSENTKMLLNASGQKNVDGTQIIIWGHENLDAPNHAEFRFIPTDTPGNITQPKHPFTDVKSGSYYEDAVVWALNNNVTSGTSDNTFSPNDTCTRGQVVAFLWRANGTPEPKGALNSFTDVKPEDYYYKAVLWAVENEITSGTSAVTFSPNEKCTTAQVLTFLYRANNGDATKEASSPYYANAVQWAEKKGMFSSTGKAFNSNESSPRSDIVTYLYITTTK